MPRSVGAEGRAGLSGRLRASARGRASEDPLDACSGGFEPEPCQDACDSSRSPAGPFAPEIFDELLDQSRKTVHGRSSLDEVTDSPEEIIPPVYESLHGDEEHPGRGPGGKTVPGSVPEDVEPLNGSGSWPSSGRNSFQSSPEEVVFGPELLHPLIEEVNFGGQGPPAVNLDSPAVVG